MKRVQRLLISAAVALTWSACGDNVEPPPIEPPPDVPVEPPACEPAPPQATATEPLLWKGAEPLLNDLGRALALDRAQVCHELGSVPCEQLYRIALGASDPIGLSLYEPVDMPLANTPTVVERVVLAACIRRVDLDRDLGAAAAVFADIDLDAAALDASSAAVAEQIRALYQRLLGRDPGAAEVAAVASLADPVDGQSVTARDFAVSACMAIASTIASTTDFLFM